MRRYALALALASSAVVPAMAADLPSRAPPPVFVPPPPIFTWTGFYIGGYGGYSWGPHQQVVFQGRPRFAGKAKIKGADGGGIVGYNYQISRIVVGLEGDAGYDGQRGKGRLTPRGRADLGSDGIIARVRGRVGFSTGNFLPFLGDALIYAAGGGSYLSERDTFTGGPFGNGVIGKKDRFGYNVGGGVEFAVTTNWILRGEYIHDDFGKENVRAGRRTYQSKVMDNTVRGAVEYKF